MDYYLNNLTESEIDRTTVALAAIILSQNTIMLQDENLRVTLVTFYVYACHSLWVCVCVYFGDQGNHYYSSNL